MAAMEIYLLISEIHVATLRGKLIGAIVLFPLNANEQEKRNIAVEESLQGNGIDGLMRQIRNRNCHHKRSEDSY